MRMQRLGGACFAALSLLAGCNSVEEASTNSARSVAVAYNLGGAKRIPRGCVLGMAKGYKMATVPSVTTTNGSVRRAWRFKSAKPRRRDKTGAYYDRFELTETIYVDALAASQALGAKHAVCRKKDPMLTKGRVSFELVVANVIYGLHTDCLMNRRINRHITTLQREVLAGAKADPHSILRYACGGGCKRE